jgi:4-hydroxy-tetrahydrodipicolinate reductase
MSTESSAANLAAGQARVIRVAVCGAKGKMGREFVKTILADPELQLAGVVTGTPTSDTVNAFFSTERYPGMGFDTDLHTLLQRETPDVCVDLTHPGVVFENSMTIIQANCRPVIGTTGLTSEQLATLDAELKARHLGGMVVPNFAIGAVLLMKFAQEAAKYFDHAEIIELHHNQKADAPSGTALKTAELMRESRAQFGTTNAPEKESIPGARGASGPADIHIHSIRLPGFIAHQEVILGSPGQILTLRHDSMDRACFMPGIALCVKKSLTLSGLVYGLEKIL